MDSTASIVHMLFSIISDIKTFIVILLLILFAFGAAFHLILRRNNDHFGDHLHINVADGSVGGSTSKPGQSTDADGMVMYDDTVLAFVAVYDMMYGAFDIENFSNAPVFPAVAIVNFLIFMLLVPTVMLNALIAFMNGTYERIDANQTAAILTEKLELTLEFEANMRYTPGHPELANWKKKFRAIFTLSIPFSVREPYLHLLAPQKTTPAAEIQARRSYRRERDVQREVLDIDIQEQQLELGGQLRVMQRELVEMQQSMSKQLESIRNSVDSSHVVGEGD